MQTNSENMHAHLWLRLDDSTQLTPCILGWQLPVSLWQWSAVSSLFFGVPIQNSAEHAYLWLQWWHDISSWTRCIATVLALILALYCHCTSILLAFVLALILALYCHCIATVLTLYWHCTGFCIGTVLAWYWPCTGTCIGTCIGIVPALVLALVLALYCHQIGTVLPLYCHCTSIVLALYWHCTGITLASYWHCIGTIMGDKRKQTMCWETKGCSVEGCVNYRRKNPLLVNTEKVDEHSSLMWSYFYEHEITIWAGVFCIQYTLSRWRSERR